MPSHTGIGQRAARLAAALAAGALGVESAATLALGPRASGSSMVISAVMPVVTSSESEALVAAMPAELVSAQLESSMAPASEAVTGSASQRALGPAVGDAGVAGAASTGDFIASTASAASGVHVAQYRATTPCKLMWGRPS